MEIIYMNACTLQLKKKRMNNRLKGKPLGERPVNKWGWRTQCGFGKKKSAKRNSWNVEITKNVANRKKISGVYIRLEKKENQSLQRKKIKGIRKQNKNKNFSIFGNSI